MRTINLEAISKKNAVDLTIVENARKLGELSQDNSKGVKSSDFNITHPLESELYRKATQVKVKTISSLIKVPTYAF